MGRTRNQLHPHSTTTRIMDILEVNQPCTMTIDQLMLELEERYGVEPKLATVRKAIVRLAAKGLITRRYEPFYDYDRPPKLVDGWGIGRAYIVRRRVLLGVA